MNLDGSGKRVLTAGLDRSVGSPAWSADGRAIYVQVEDRGINKVERVGLDGSIRDVATRPHRRRARPALCRRRVQRRAQRRGRGHRPAIRSTRPTRRGNGRRRPPASRISTNMLGCQGAGAGPEAARSPRAVDQRPIDAWMVTPPDFDPAKQIPADPRDPRRPLLRLRPELLDRRPALCRGRLCRALYQPARLDLLRRGVRQPDRQGLSRATIMTT